MDSRVLDLENALKRTISMLIGRLRAYGRRWEIWVESSHNRTKANIIPEKHQDKKILFQGPDGEYEIHGAILDYAKKLRLR